ncbi:MAG: pilus assembly protein PilM [Candidatus Omnitrophica bacterium]|nr:pilus assembly protein PilM [Candidatus Omnitrophota bacterium]
MLNKSNDFISVAFTDDILKVAYVRGAGENARVDQLVVKEVKGLSEQNQVKAVHAATKGMKVKGGNVLLIIPSNMVTTKNIEIPSTNTEEIKSIVSLQASRHTPFSREEIQTGYINFGVYKNNFTKVLLVIANKKLLREKINILEKAGMRVNKIVFGPEGMARMYSDALGLSGESVPSGVISIGYDSTDFIIVHKGTCISARNIPVGKVHFNQEGAIAEEKLVEELSRTIESYKNEDIEAQPAQYLLTSDDKMAQDMQLLLKEKLSWNTEIIPYQDNMKMAPSLFKKKSAQYADHSFFDVASAGITATKSFVDLMPEDIQLQKSVEEQGREVFKTGVLAVVILVLIAAIIGLRLYFKSAYLAKIQADYTQTRTEVEKLNHVVLGNRLIREFLNGRNIGLDALYEIYQNIPREIYLTNLFFDEDGSLSLSGIADEVSLVYEWKDSLENTGFFHAVDEKSNVSKKDRGKDVQAFEFLLKVKSLVAQESEPQKELKEE